MSRIIRWCDDGSEYGADPLQDEQLFVELEFAGEGVKAVATPAVQCTQLMVDDDEPSAVERHTHSRGAAARAGYLPANRPDGKCARRSFAGGCPHR